MKFRVGFVSNSSSSSFVCTYIGIPSKKIIKKKGGVPFINNQELVVEQDPDEEGYEDEDYEEYGNEDKALQYSLDKFFRKSKIKHQQSKIAPPPSSPTRFSTRIAPRLKCSATSAGSKRRISRSVIP